MAPRSSAEQFTEADRKVIRRMADAASVAGTKSSPRQTVPDPIPNRKK